MVTLSTPDRLGYDNDFAWEEARYPGSRNGLTHFQRFLEENVKPGHHFVFRWFANFPCNYDLRMFPFDQQNCELEFKMRNAIKAQVISAAGK